MLGWLLAVALTAFLVEATRRLAPVIGLVDVPTERKSHQGEVPLVGGIAIFLGLVLTLGIFGVLQDHWAFLVAAAMLVVIGIYDDVNRISPTVRLFLHGATVLFVGYFGNVFMFDIGTLLPGDAPLELGWMAIPFTVFAGVGLINAFNLIDGLDGLCGALALVVLIGLGIVSGLADKQNELALIVVLAGGLVGFLAFNVRVPGRKQAKAFLGDAGSYLLGLSIFYLTVRLSQGTDRAMVPVTALWFCMVPLFDTVGMILRRYNRGRSLFAPDREHLHHVFLLAKFTVIETWAGLIVVALLGMSVGLAGALMGIPEILMMAAFLIAAFLHYTMIRKAWMAMRFLRRSINRRIVVQQGRRCGADRRINSTVFYIEGVPVERRSGQDRRDQDDDRRRSDEEAARVAELQGVDRPGNRAA